MALDKHVLHASFGIVVIILGVLIYNIPRKPSMIEGQVIHVLDAKTIIVATEAGEERVILSDISVPYHHAKCDDEREKGQAASAYLRALLPVGTAVTIDDKQSDKALRRYLDGEITADVRRGDGRYIKDILLTSPHAKAWPRDRHRPWWGC